VANGNGNGRSLGYMLAALFTLMGLAGTMGTFAYGDAKGTAVHADAAAEKNHHRLDSLELVIMKTAVERAHTEWIMMQQLAAIAQEVGAEVTVDTTQVNPKDTL
jgi:hypothetical protein